MVQKNDPQSVIIVGAGVVGIASAYYLRRAGFDVTVIEKGSSGWCLFTIQLRIYYSQSRAAVDGARCVRDRTQIPVQSAITVPCQTEFQPCRLELDVAIRPSLQSPTSPLCRQASADDSRCVHERVSGSDQTRGIRVRVAGKLG